MWKDGLLPLGKTVINARNLCSEEPINLLTTDTDCPIIIDINMSNHENQPIPGKTSLRERTGRVIRDEAGYLASAASEARQIASDIWGDAKRSLVEDVQTLKQPGGLKKIWSEQLDIIEDSSIAASKILKDFEKSHAGDLAKIDRLFGMENICMYSALGASASGMAAGAALGFGYKETGVEILGLSLLSGMITMESSFYLQTTPESRRGMNIMDDNDIKTKKKIKKIINTTGKIAKAAIVTGSIGFVALGIAEVELDDLRVTPDEGRVPEIASGIVYQIGIKPHKTHHYILPEEMKSKLEVRIAECPPGVDMRRLTTQEVEGVCKTGTYVESTRHSDKYQLHEMATFPAQK